MKWRPAILVSKLAALIAAVAAGCAPAITIGPDHPAAASAPAGRLAGPPAALRADLESVEPSGPDRSEPPPTHHHHGSEPDPAPKPD